MYAPKKKLLAAKCMRIHVLPNKVLWRRKSVKESERKAMLMLWPKDVDDDGCRYNQQVAGEAGNFSQFAKIPQSVKVTQCIRKRRTKRRKFINEKKKNKKKENELRESLKSA